MPLRGRKHSPIRHTPMDVARIPHRPVCTVLQSSSFWNCEASLTPRPAHHPNPAVQLLFQGQRGSSLHPSPHPQRVQCWPSPETPFTGALPRSTWGGQATAGHLAEQTCPNPQLARPEGKDKQFPFASSPAFVTRDPGLRNSPGPPNLPKSQLEKNFWWGGSVCELSTAMTKRVVLFSHKQQFST